MFIKSRSSPAAQHPQTQLTELVQAAKNGDEDAFFQLISAQKEKLYRMAFSYLKNETDALEAVQETTFRAYTKLGKLREPHFFGTWVMRILINYCIKEKRRRDKQTAFVQQTESAGNEINCSRLHIQLALEQLEPKYRQIIILKYFEDWTIREIAKALRCPDSTIKTRLYKALKGLRGKMQTKGEPSNE